MWSDSGPEGQEIELTFIEQARRRQIVEVTIEVLAEVGYGKASLALIAQRAGISKGVISYHFRGKAELMAQVEASITEAVEAVIRPRVEAETTGRGMLHAFLRSYLEYMRDHRSQVLASNEIFFMRARTEDRSPGYETFGYESVYEGLESILRFGQEKGEFGPFDTQVMAVSLWGIAESVSTQWAAHPQLDLDHYINEVMAIVDRATQMQ